MKKYFFSIIIILFTINILAQPNINLLDKKVNIGAYGGLVIPGNEFSSKSINGLFAKNGYQIGFDVNYIIAYGLGIGFNYEFNRFKFDQDAFIAFAQPDSFLISKGYNSGKFALNAQVNIPIEIIKNKFAINLYGEGNAGLRTMSIPSIDLKYNELSNRFVEVSYRARTSSMGFLGYSAGVQFIFSKKFGINLSYNALIKSRHSIKYSVRKFDAQGELYEEESYVNNYLDHSGYQFGIVFWIGGKK